MLKTIFCTYAQCHLSYQFNQKTLKQIGISGLRLYVTGQNLFIITKYKGYYPELDSSGRGTNNQAVNAQYSPTLYSMVLIRSLSGSQNLYSRCECSIINFLKIIL
jgi:hypothetical protein